MKMPFMTFREYVAYLDHPNYLRGLIKLIYILKGVIKILSMFIGGALVGEYASRKIKLKG